MAKDISIDACEKLLQEYAELKLKYEKDKRQYDIDYDMYTKYVIDHNDWVNTSGKYVIYRDRTPEKARFVTWGESGHYDCYLCAEGKNAYCNPELSRRFNHDESSPLRVHHTNHELGRLPWGGGPLGVDFATAHNDLKLSYWRDGNICNPSAATLTAWEWLYQQARPTPIVRPVLPTPPVLPNVVCCNQTFSDIEGGAVNFEDIKQNCSLEVSVNPTGSSPTGSSPTGSSPTGSSPTGSSPTGSSVTKSSEKSKENYTYYFVFGGASILLCICSVMIVLFIIMQRRSS